MEYPYWGHTQKDTLVMLSDAINYVLSRTAQIYFGVSIAALVFFFVSSIPPHSTLNDGEFCTT
jgi:hypothetical protein